MRCRHFTLRLTAQHAQEDEDRLNAFLQQVGVQSIQTAAGAPGCWSILVFYEELTVQGRGVPADESGVITAAAATPQAEREQVAAPELSPAEQYIYERLREWRSQRASVEGKPPYIIANNAVLMQIAKRHMSIKVAEDLAAIKQFGPARTTRYGPDILQLLYVLADEAPLFEEER